MRKSNLIKNEMSNSIRIAVLMTCHNRCDTTLACLDALFKQALSADITFKVYLVDDGSTDGTGQAIKKKYPSVLILQGNGNLYWGGGMRMAWTEAMKDGYDYYLWLNDDTILFIDAIHVLVKTERVARNKDGQDGIVVGSVMDTNTGQCIYGGYKQPKKNSLKLETLTPNQAIQSCDTFNGNLVLVSCSIEKKIGNISVNFRHSIGDIDYGLRALKQGIPIRVAPKYLGQCKGNPREPWTDPRISLIERIKYLYSSKGLSPLEWRIFTKRHFGYAWIIYYVKLYLRVLFPWIWIMAKKYLNKKDLM